MNNNTEIPKVYCSDCRFLRSMGNNTPIPFLGCCCPANISKRETFLEIRLVHMYRPDILNKNNNCKHYETVEAIKQNNTLS